MSDNMVVSLKKPQRPEVRPQDAQSPPPARPRAPLPKREGIAAGPLAIIAALCALALGYYFFFSGGQEPSASEERAEAQAVENAQVAQEVKDVIAAVERHIVLPAGEEPTVATVTDPEKLKDQAFFANAKTGYKVLIYTQARKAFLYDPVSDRLIEVAPISTEIE